MTAATESPPTMREDLFALRLAKGEPFPDLVAKELPLRQRELAAGMGVSPQLVSAALNGREYGERQRQAVAEALGVSRAWLDRHLDAYVLARWGEPHPWRTREKARRQAASNVARGGLPSDVPARGDYVGFVP